MEARSEKLFRFLTTSAKIYSDLSNYLNQGTNELKVGQQDNSIQLTPLRVDIWQMYTPFETSRPHINSEDSPAVNMLD